jgi:hypothetical protein
MGTRSDIIVHRADNKWHRVYCHWDGYLDHNGQILFKHYSGQDLAEALVAPGDMSSLQEKCDKPDGHSHESPVEGHTVYYGRDRGESDVAGKIGASLAEVWPPADSWTEYTYVWTDGKWWVGDPDEGKTSLIELGDALEGKKTIHPNIKAFGLVLGKHA